MADTLFCSLHCRNAVKLYCINLKICFVEVFLCFRDSLLKKSFINRFLSLKSFWRCGKISKSGNMFLLIAINPVCLFLVTTYTSFTARVEIYLSIFFPFTRVFDDV